jgi:hypothetical protein
LLNCRFQKPALSKQMRRKLDRILKSGGIHPGGNYGISAALISSRAVQAP